MFKVNPISTNQDAMHEDLDRFVAKYRASSFQRPIAQHSKAAFDTLKARMEQDARPLIIDACCGVGESTIALAKRFPEALVIGVDKSQVRLQKHAYYHQIAKPLERNYLIIHAELLDFWRLLASAKAQLKWQIDKQFIFYPNPYPKKTQLTKRWYAHAIMPSIMACSSTIECRSNWLLYLQEFQQALLAYSIHSVIQEVEEPAITPFERKYLNSHQPCWRLLSETMLNSDLEHIE